MARYGPAGCVRPRTAFLPSPSVLTAEQRTEDPATYKSEVLHEEPDGSFSIVALVLLPGQVTPIHDRVTWCVFGVIHGMEREELRPSSATVVSGRVSRTLGHGGADRELPRSRGNLLCIQELR